MDNDLLSHPDVDVDIMDEVDFEDLVVEDDDEVHDEDFLVDLVEVHDEVVLEINNKYKKNLSIEIFYLHRN
jgi:disulfide oxidoreductase YuzD